MEKIDNLDKKILEIITGNACIPFKDVNAAYHARPSTKGYSASSTSVS